LLLSLILRPAGPGGSLQNNAGFQGYTGFKAGNVP